MVSRQDTRFNQKHRTRRAIIEAAVELVRAGRQPSVAEAAEAALVSKATAYRYFPTQQSLLGEVGLEARHPSPEELLVDVADDDPVARWDAVLRSVHAVMTADEALFRTMTKVFQERWLESAAESEQDPVVREGRRLEYVDAILEPLRPQLSDEALYRLRCGLTLILGMEPISILEDVCGLRPEQTLDILRWAGTTLIQGSTKADAP